MPKILKLKSGLVVVAAICLVVFFAAAAISVVVFFLKEMQVQRELIEDVERRYGGLVVGDIHVAGGKHIEAITLADVNPSGTFYKSGVRSGNIVVTDQTIGEFLMALDQPPGSIIYIDVVDGGNGPPIRQRSIRRIKLISP